MADVIAQRAWLTAAMALVGAAAGQLFSLDRQHASDDVELAAAFHLIQARILMRPTYAAYLELQTAQDQARAR